MCGSAELFRFSGIGKYIMSTMQWLVADRESKSTESVITLKEECAAPLRSLQQMARRIAKVMTECKLPVSENEYVQSFRVELMESVLQWCRGATFAEICKVRVPRNI